MTDQTFRGRIKVSCLHFAAYILGEDVTTPAHSSRVRWAQSVAASADMVASQIQPMVVMDAQVQTDGAAITDAALQTSVETTVNKLL